MTPEDFPEVKLTVDEFRNLSFAGPNVDLSTVEIRYTFRCNPSIKTNEIVMGKIVERDDLYTAQLGGRLCIDERGLNRYKVSLVGAQEEIKKVYDENRKLALESVETVPAAAVQTSMPTAGSRAEVGRTFFKRFFGR